MVRALDSQSKGPWFKTTGQHNTNSTTGQPKVKSAYHPSEVDQMGSKTSWGNSDKKYSFHVATFLCGLEPHP